jgi:transposase-like protein
LENEKQPEVIAEAISCRKRGMPYQQVSKHFKEYERAEICPATAYNWVRKYGKALRNFNMKQTPDLSGKISIDEFLSKIKKNKTV